MHIPFTGLKRQYANLREELLDVTDCVLTSGYLMNGVHTTYFEDWLANKNNSMYAVLCHSGTHALEILDSYYKTEHTVSLVPRSYTPTVLIPAMTFPASANAFIRAGWNVHFVDTDAYGNMNLDSVPRDIDYQAILGIGLYGSALPNRLRRIRPLVIEDAAQHWLSDNCHRVGEASAISFDPMKNLSNYGNGGAVVTDDRNLCDYARNWRDNGKDSKHAEIGTNSRMSETDCAQMMVKVKYINNWQQDRKRIATYWVDRLKDSAVRCLIDQSNIDAHCFHKFVIDIDSRDEAQAKLKERGIETKVHYQHPMHELGAYQQYNGPNILSVASSLSRRALSLPIYPELTSAEAEYIIEQVLDVTKK
jgi:dTDP-4-amino-4,6-dideoxygalactose transaminase